MSENEQIITVLGTVGIEGLKFLANYYLESKKLAGMTGEQVKAEFDREYTEFRLNDPQDIPDKA